MNILVTGACGFVGSRLLRRFREATEGWNLLGMDNLCRAGSETNRATLKELGVKFFHGDVRSASDFESLPPVDWVIDAAANPSVLAGVDGKSSSRQVIEHNLSGTVNMLEYCRTKTQESWNGMVSRSGASIAKTTHAGAKASSQGQREMRGER